MSASVDDVLLSVPKSFKFRPRWKPNRRRTAGFITLFLVAIFWYLATGPLGLVDPIRFPTPSQTSEAFLQISSEGYGGALLISHALHSCKLVLLGFCAAVAFGVPFGMAMGTSARFEAIFNPIFMFIRPIPPLAWIPLAIVWLGLGDSAKILVIWLAAFVPSVINSHAGVRNIEPYLMEAGQMLGISKIMFVKEILLPASLPMIFTGLRLSLQASWTTLVAGELIGAIAGLGQVLTQASLDIFPAMILVAMISVAICGSLMTLLLTILEKRAMPWRRAP